MPAGTSSTSGNEIATLRSTIITCMRPVIYEAMDRRARRTCVAGVEKGAVTG
jgi:hypothetical protein